MSNQNYVFVLDTHQKPLNPCAPGVARGLLKAGKARVFRRYPFVIILNKVVNAEPKPMKLKLDPGAKTSGIAILLNDKVVWAGELTHRGQQIKDALESRRALRRGRRNRKTRYRQPRFLNRKRTPFHYPLPLPLPLPLSTRPKGWLAPSLQHRVLTVMTWVSRLRKFAPISSISMELVRFDTQLMQNSKINGIEYQQGELAGYETREYLLEKWGRQCVYCGQTDLPLEVEHIQPKSRGGSNRISNLTLACNACNIAKGNQDIRDFLKGKPDLLNKILSQVKQPLRDAAFVNSTRWALFHRLKETELPVECGTGGRTKYNRCRLNLPKAHWLDAACVGNIESLELLTNNPLLIKATGHGTRQMCRTDKFGFPCRYVPRYKKVKGFQTGDVVKATVTNGKKVGSYAGRVAVRSTGSFNISTSKGLIQGISYKYCTIVHRKDGYNYCFNIDAC